MDLHDGTPFWPRRDGLPSVYPTLLGNESCDVVVVGGGITGSLISLELSKRGFDVVVLDRRDCGGGSTSASTAMLQYEIDELLVDLAAVLGAETAAIAYQECSRGIDLVERATQDIGHNCGFRRSPSIFMAVKARDIATLERELLARREAGFDVRWLDAEPLLNRWGLVALAAIESSAGGSVDPYLLSHRSLGMVSSRGGRVYDRTATSSFDMTTRRVVVHTDRGYSVRAKWCVFATGYEVERLLPELPFTLNTSFALVTEPIPGLDRSFPNGLLFWDHDDPYLYGRTTDDHRLLVGGKDETYRDPLRRRRALPSKTRALAEAVPKRIPSLGAVEVAYSWAGTFAETPDGLAFIGAHAKHPRCQFALGFGGNGITYSALAAQYIADSIDGTGPAPAQKIFRLDRPVVKPS